MAAWPNVTSETLNWRSEYVDYGQPESFQYEASVPAHVGELTPVATASVAALAREATQQLIRFDSTLTGELEHFGPLLLRSEAMASSQIEQLTASARSVFTAEVTSGASSRKNANEIVSATHAMIAAISLAGELTSDSVKEIHAALMAGTKHTPGHWRTEPVWIGSSSRSPRGAVFVAPKFELVPSLVEDVMSLSRRRDIPTMEQLAVVHAQFETIHPFTDGNGRTGRAVTQAMLRGLGVTRSVTVPVSAGLLADVEAYHRALSAYREGNIDPIVEEFSYAAIDAVNNAQILVEDLRGIHLGWTEQIKPRKSSQMVGLLELMIRKPVVTAHSVGQDLGIETTNSYRLLSQLTEAGVLAQKSEFKVGGVWRAPHVLSALDSFAERAGKRVAA